MTLVKQAQRGGDPFDAIQREFDGVLGRLLTGRGNEGNRLAPYAVDVREDADKLYVEAELPGFRKEDVQITVENQVLTIAAERQTVTPAPTGPRPNGCSTNGGTRGSCGASLSRRPSAAKASTPRWTTVCLRSR